VVIAAPIKQRIDRSAQASMMKPSQSGYEMGFAGSMAVAPADLHLHHPGMARTTASSTEVLAGLVDRVTFHNPENGLCVLRVKARGQRDLITVHGHTAMISAGEFGQASGIWVNDRTHGVQFRASFLKAWAPTTVEGIEKYLGSGMLHGIGPAYAKKLMRAFGEAVFDIIEQQLPRLRQVMGIGPKRAERIIAGWAEQKMIREIMLFLHSNGRRYVGGGAHLQDLWCRFCRLQAALTVAVGEAWPVPVR
jgi:hypothetical protein